MIPLKLTHIQSLFLIWCLNRLFSKFLFNLYLKFLSKRLLIWVLWHCSIIIWPNSWWYNFGSWFFLKPLAFHSRPRHTSYLIFEWTFFINFTLCSHFLLYCEHCFYLIFIICRGVLIFKNIIFYGFYKFLFLSIVFYILRIVIILFHINLT